MMPPVFGCRNAFKKILCRFLCNKAEPRQPGALVRMGLVPFAPHTVAIGLADRFPPAAVVTAASEGSQVRQRQTAACNLTVSGNLRCLGVLLVASLVFALRIMGAFPMKLHPIPV